MMKVVFPLIARSIYKDSYMLVWSILFPLVLFIGLGTYHDDESFRENLFIGCILVSLVMGSINTSGFWTMTQRRRGVFKLMKLSTLPVSKFFLISMLARFFIYIAISVLLLVSGMLLFGLRIHAFGMLILLGLLVIGLICFNSIGYIISSRARDEGMMNMMSTAISFPMIFISNTFYSLDHAPEWLQFISKINPFEYVSLIGRNALAGVFDIPSSIVLLLFAIASAIIAIKTFRYE